MEYVSYQMVSTDTGSLNTGSYLNRTEASLFGQGVASDLWYGFSTNDVIELGVFDRSKNFVAWKTIHQEKEFRDVSVTYLDEKDRPVSFTYSELLPSFTLYKNEKILVEPAADLSASFGIVNGSYTLTYNFTREMAGIPSAPLVIKEVSPSRTELKLIPIKGSTPHYEAFCQKKVLMRDVSPLYLQKTKDCPYSNVYSTIHPSYPKEIATLKTLFFLNSDGAVVDFIKNLYEDIIVYTKPPVTEGVVSEDPEKLYRIQGIRTSFSNYLLSNSDKIVGFEEIDAQFALFVTAAIERKFSPVGKKPAKEYVDAKKFLYDFFVSNFYKSVTNLLQGTYKEKYFSHLKNALNLGNNRLLPIIDHGVMVEDGSYTLLVKLQKELPNDIGTQTECWVSNISLTPFVLNVVVRSVVGGQILRIGPPNFSVALPDVSLSNVNKAYTATDLENSTTVERELTVSRKLTDLNIDYSEFSNFVVFSSAETRLEVFRNKILQLNNLSSSLVQLNATSSTFLAASGSTYPFYDEEEENIQDQMDDIVNSFDGYESYLYRSGIYTYSDSAFISSSYITELESSASYYDKFNRDSLVNNTPDHVWNDADSEEYVVFLSMVGHYFDELYAYISSLPSERKIGSNTSEEFTRRVVDQMLETFGWKLDDTLEESNLVNNYLNSDQVSGLNAMSAEDRLKAIRNRILLNLPQIYKTKGTEEAIRMLLSCYGIPSSLLSIREFGGVNYGTDAATFTQNERAYLYRLDETFPWNFLILNTLANKKTILFKMALDDATDYPIGHDMTIMGDIGGGVGATTLSGSGAWGFGFRRHTDGKSGQLFFRLGYKGYELAKMYTDPFPLFNNEIYSVMIRRNDPAEDFEYTTTENIVPTQYDLWVKRNESGRTITSVSASTIVYSQEANANFNYGSALCTGGWFYHVNELVPLNMTFDKLQIWADVIGDSNFEDYVNYINSYSYSGSLNAEKALMFRMHVEYPFDVRQRPSGSTLDGNNDPGITAYSVDCGFIPNGNPYYATGSIQRLTAAYPDTSFGQVDRIFIWNVWSGSQELAYNTSSCQWASQSAFPYQFRVVDSPCTYNISKYGPNKFRNEKVKYVTQSLDVRLDTEARSTYIPRATMSPDSNQVAFVVDPQDFKNKDIIRFFGNYDFMSVIGDPNNAHSASYEGLRTLRKQYAQSKTNQSGSKTLFNELFTIYKLYFNRSVFESIKNLVPARSAPIVGVVVEPTILERPKYEIKPVAAEINSGSAYYFDVTASRYFRDANTKVCRMTQSLQHADFNIDYTLMETASFNTSSLPQNLEMGLDVSDINCPSFAYPLNYAQSGMYIPDCLDRYQHGHFGTGGGGETPFDQTINSKGNTSGSFHLMRRWSQHKLYFKSGSWERSDNRAANAYTTQSIMLYEYVLVPAAWFNDLAYSEETITRDNVDPYGRPSETHIRDSVHDAFTFRRTPNSKFNNIRSTLNWNGLRYISEAPFFTLDDNTYLEIVDGYPRNHLTRKRPLFSLFSVKVEPSGSYRRGRQTIDTTIGDDGLENGMSPVQYIDVGNIVVVQSDNVINH
jgi:hypothetical protein